MVYWRAIIQLQEVGRRRVLALMGMSKEATHLPLGGLVDDRA